MLTYNQFISEMALEKTKDGLKVPEKFTLVVSPTKRISDGIRKPDRIIPKNAERLRGTGIRWFDGEKYYIAYKDHRV